MYREFYKKLVNSSWNEKMKHMRIYKKWTQKQAAEKCLTYHKTYWSWENGKQIPRKSSQKLIAKAFKVKPEYLFSDIIMSIFIIVLSF